MTHKGTRRFGKWLGLLALLALAACGKEPPGPPQIHNQAQAYDYYKNFSVHWNPGTYLTGGRAQYAQSDTQRLSGHNDSQAKIDLFLFDDDTTYLLEYWELTPARLQGGYYQGRWFVNEKNQLVLLDGNSNNQVATGDPLALPNGKGGVSLQFADGLDLKKTNANLLATNSTAKWALSFTAGATNRTLPADLKKNLPSEMSDTNSRNVEHAFKD